MTITRIESPINAPTTALVVSAPYCPGPVLTGTSNSALTIPDIDQLPRSYDFIVNEFNTAFKVGARMRAAVEGTSNQWAEGVVTAFNYNTNTVTLAVDRVAGSGITHGGQSWLTWTLNVAGEQGLRGEQGPVGPRGQAGEPGGPQGERGPTGNQGHDGPTGPEGPTGVDGVAATITVGSTQTVAVGSMAEVTNSGTNTAVILDFVIPGGGPIGPIGPQGPTGLAGGVTSALAPLVMSGSGELSLDVASPLAVTADELGLSIAAPLVVSTNQLGLSITSPLVVTAGQLGFNDAAYSLINGSRAFTAVVNGVAPAATAADASLPTAAWVLARIQEIEIPSQVTYSLAAFLTAGNHTYTTPSDSTTDTVYRVRMVGAGGGGGSVTGGVLSGGGGGGAGQYKELIVRGLAPDTAVPIIVGTAGASMTSGSSSRITINGQHIECNGGLTGEGARGAGSTPSGTAYGGAGGANGASPTVAGVITLLDIPGGNGTHSSQYAQQANGGASAFGPGAATPTMGVPAAATSYGSGGAGTTAHAVGAGGAGAPGAVFIERIQG